MLTEFAPAKINLYLHVTGRRPDGYHNLDSLVAFSGVGDEIQLEPAKSFSFKLEGPYGAALNGEPLSDNLVAKAAASLAELVKKPLTVAMTLIKNLPVASGIGGGSSDAAAALRVLGRYWGLAMDDHRLFRAAAKHGQDVPVCLNITNNYITAEGTLPAHALPHADIVLVNPNQALPTPSVYKAFRESGAPFSPPARFVAAPLDLADMVEQLKLRSNDLYPAACQLQPVVDHVIAALDTTAGCLLARMSGSGATCFGIYGSESEADTAARKIKAENPGWWVVPSYIPHPRMKV
jgi:4-diphosphocytidyl-2-C-methyl-D-erythritol kinase